MSGGGAVLALACVIGAGYAYGAWRVRRSGGRWPRSREALVGVAVVLVGAAVLPPVGSWAPVDPRAHMVQHLLVGMFAGIALALAAPLTLLRAALPPVRRPGVRRLVRSYPWRVLTHPVTAAVLDVGGLWLLYRTPLLERAHHSGLVGGLVLVHLLLAGTLLAWALAGPERVGRPDVALRLGVLVMASAAHAVLAKDLYAAAAGPGGAGVTAWQDAARLMYYGGDLAEVLLAVLVLRAWWRRRTRRSVGLPPDRLPPVGRVRPASGPVGAPVGQG